MGEDFEVNVTLDRDHVAIVEFRRGDYNFFSVSLIESLADHLEELGDDGSTRCVVLCSGGKHFCAGADFSDGPATSFTSPSGQHLYESSLRLFRQPLPVIAAVQGAAIGGGLGLALACDFRIATTSSRFTAPFARLGLHHGFGLTVTLPQVVGQQRATDLLYTARSLGGDEAMRIGLCDRVCEPERLRREALALATSIAANAPIAVRSIRETMRSDLAAKVERAMERERSEQDLHRRTADFAEGILADGERRRPEFVGQ